MTQVNFHQLGEVKAELLRFVVTAARFEQKWVFSKHKARETWDMPGGHIEPGETAADAMRRELWEETGAREAKIQPVCVYSVTDEDAATYGMLFYSEISALGALPEAFEMEKILLTDKLPEELTYPEIIPALFSCIQGWMNQQSNPNELWDIYDENRNRTGRLHRRGDPLPNGEYHLVVHVWMLNGEGEFLLTKRSPNKGFPNMWESTGGSALAGDDSLRAAMREVKEETGLELDPKKGKCVISGTKMDFIRDVWLFRQDFPLEDVVLLPGETVDKMYADAGKIRQMRMNGEFVPYDYLEELFSMI